MSQKHEPYVLIADDDPFYFGVPEAQDSLQHTAGVRFDLAPFVALKLEYRRLDDSRSLSLDEYRDKLILGWRHHFSADAQILISVSHEVSVMGFGGGNLQFQMFF